MLPIDLNFAHRVGLKAVEIAIALPIFCAAFIARTDFSRIDLEEQMAYCCKMDVLSPRQFHVVTGISPRRFLQSPRKGTNPLFEYGRSSILAGTPPLPTTMRTCRSRPEGNLFRRQCILHAVRRCQECMPDVYRAIRLARLVCRNNTRLRSSTQSVLARSSEGRQPGATWAITGISKA